MLLKKNSPPAVVLSFSVTGLATIRCLAKLGIDVYGVQFNAGHDAPETKYSRLGKIITVDFSESDDDLLCDWLIEFSRTLFSKTCRHTN